MKTWFWIPGWKDYYKISTRQQVKSVDRKVKGRKGYKVLRGKLLTQFLNKDGYLTVKLSKEGITQNFTVHQLMLLTFKGSCPSGQMSRHFNDVKTDNRIENLFYGTNSQNQLDAVRNGRYSHIANKPRNSKGRFSCG